MLKFTQWQEKRLLKRLEKESKALLLSETITTIKNESNYIDATASKQGIKLPSVKVMESANKKQLVNLFLEDFKADSLENYVGSLAFLKFKGIASRSRVDYLGLLSNFFLTIEVQKLRDFEKLLNDYVSSHAHQMETQVIIPVTVSVAGGHEVVYKWRVKYGRLVRSAIAITSVLHPIIKALSSKPWILEIIKFAFKIGLGKVLRRLIFKF